MMAINQLRKLFGSSLLQASRTPWRKFHAAIQELPQIPFSPLHDPNSYILVTESGTIDRNYLIPTLPKLDKAYLMRRRDELISQLEGLRVKLLTQSSQLDLILLSSEALQTTARTGGTLRHYLTLSQGSLNAELINLTGKLKTNADEVTEKVTKLRKDLEEGPMMTSLQQRWQLVKEKLPAWQAQIANKLQTIQDNINKRIN